ncbi:uncharacterized protein LOC129737578 [Uranotaenia lowii]|uniref:uncharacterized protein LOC129737578 n=1 Tax=Uranotaenia lowii TaxID=190385 RepID=UPI00247AB447|nr:uncharacterized protein LOC129737578 [Uranotaenia lowii]
MAGIGIGSNDDPPDLDTSRLPSYCRSPQNDGVLRVLQLRMRFNEDGYDSDDVQRKGNRPSLPQNPFLIGNSVKTAIGYSNARHVRAIKEARGAMYTLRTYSPEIAEKLMNMNTLIDKTPVEVVPHPILSITQGVIVDYDTIDMEEEELLEELSVQGIAAVRRIKKRDEKNQNKFKNTPTLVLSFRSTVLPEYVNFGLLRIKTRPYYPSPMICRNCAAYGHTLKRCTSPAICLTCSEDHTMEKDKQCEKASFCKHCKGDHSPISRDCPVFRKEEAVIRLKVNKGITFHEARTEINSTWGKETYASKVQQRLNITVESEKDNLIKKLQSEMDKMRKEIELLRTQIPTTESKLTDKRTVSQTQKNDVNATTPTPRYSRKDLIHQQSRLEKQKFSKNNKEPYNPKDTLNRSMSRKRILHSPPLHLMDSKKSNIRSNSDDHAMSEDE